MKLRTPRTIILLCSIAISAFLNIIWYAESSKVVPEEKPRWDKKNSNPFCVNVSACANTFSHLMCTKKMNIEIN